MFQTTKPIVDPGVLDERREVYERGFDERRKAAERAPDDRAIIHALADILRTEVFGPIKEIQQKLAVLEVLEDTGARNRGAWKKGTFYRERDLVRHRGSLWLCCASSEGAIPPGKSLHWIKRGEHAK